MAMAGEEELTMASSSSSSSLGNDLILEAIQDFRQRFNTDLPLDLDPEHFYEEAKVIQSAQLAKSQCLHAFFEKVKFLDLDRIPELTTKLCSELMKMIEEILSKNEERKKKKELCLKKEVEDLCRKWKSSLELKMKMNTGMDRGSIEDFLVKAKTLAVSSFEHLWCDDGNGYASFLEDYKRMLEDGVNGVRREMEETFVGGSGNGRANEAKKKARDEPKASSSSSTPHPENAKVASSASSSNQLPVEVQSKKVKVALSSSSSSSSTKAPPPVKAKMASSSSSNQLPEPVNMALASLNKIPARGKVAPSPSSSKSLPVKAQMTKRSRNRAKATASATDSRKSRATLPLPSTSTAPSTSAPLKKGKDNKRRSQNEDGDGDVGGKTCKRPKLAQVKSSTLIPTSTSATSGENYLIFRLASKLISVGTVTASKFEKHESLSLPPIVGVGDDGLVVCGNDAMECSQKWWLDELLEEMPIERKKISGKISGNKNLRGVVTLEFVLGLLLKKMKLSSEALLGKDFTSAIITLPMWFCSPQRIRIRDAAIIAGFASEKIHLINEESLAVCACASTSTKPDRQTKLRVISENFGVINAIQWQLGSVGSSLKHVYVMHREEYRSIPKDLPISRKMDRVISLCPTSSSSFSNQDTLIFLTDSGEWMEIFKKVAKNGGHHYSDLGNQELFGASIFSRKNPQEIYEYVREYLPASCIPHPWRRDEPRKILTREVQVQFVRELEMKVFIEGDEEEENPKIYQESVKTREKVILGEVVFRGKERYGEELLKKAMQNGKLVLTFSVSAEAVVTLEGMQVEMMNGGKKKKKGGSKGEQCLVRLEDFGWKIEKLTEAETEEVKGVVDSILRE